MPALFGRQWEKDELRAFVGDMAQLAGIERIIHDDGTARGVRAANMRTGSGLEAEVLVDRAMDLGRVSLNGINLAFRTPAGITHPAYYDTDGPKWLRTFGAGLLTTCGLQNVGSPSEEDGRAYGVHGGISATPATDVNVVQGWDNDTFRFSISGKVKESTDMGLFGPQLAVRRTISSELGGNYIHVQDQIENEGFRPSPVLVLYHVNVGFPVVTEETRLVGPSSHVEARDADAEPGLNAHNRFEKPKANYDEQVFFHTMEPDERGRVRAMLTAPQFPGVGRMALCLAYQKAELPEFVEWKMMRSGCYVVGMEPANCRVMGRVAERERGPLQLLKPGEQKTVDLRISVITDDDEIDEIQREAFNKTEGSGD